MVEFDQKVCTWHDIYGQNSSKLLNTNPIKCGYQELKLGNRFTCEALNIRQYEVAKF